MTELNLIPFVIAVIAAYITTLILLTRRSKTQDSKDVDSMIDQIARRPDLVKPKPAVVARSKADEVQDVARSKAEKVKKADEVQDVARSKAEKVKKADEVQDVARSKAEKVKKADEVQDVARSKAEKVKKADEVQDVARSKAEKVKKADEVQDVTSNSDLTEKVEFHVLLNPLKSELYERLTRWIPDNMDVLKSVGMFGSRAMATQTSVGISKIQPMFTCWMNMNPSENIQKRLMSIEKMIARVVADEDNTSEIKKLDVEDTGYIEFHMKVDNIKTRDDWIKLARFCAQHRIVLLMNKRARNGPFPTTTYREYRTNMKSFLVSQNRIIEAFKAAGYRTSKVHTETSPDGCDSKPGTDYGWAIFERYQNSWQDHFSGRKSFNECFRWIEESDFTEESYNPPEGWEEAMQEWLKDHPDFD